MDRGARRYITGTIEFNGENYNIISGILASNKECKKMLDTISEYRKEHNLFVKNWIYSTKPYAWSVKNGKLYLVGLYLDSRLECEVFREGSIYETITLSEDERFLSCFSGDISLLISKKDILSSNDTMTEEEKRIADLYVSGRILVELEIINLSFEKGELIKIGEKENEFFIERRRFDYYDLKDKWSVKL